MDLWDDSHILLAAIDGMGGEEGGEVAAATARDAIISYLQQHHDSDDRTLIAEAITFANNEIIRAKESMPSLHRMGCVATAGIIDTNAATLSIAHVGDSRLYLCSHGEISKLTHDHSLVGYQEEKGYLTEEEAMNHPRRSVIERCLGMELHNTDDKNFIESNVFYIDPGDIFLFCSDGVCDMITKAQIKQCLLEGKDPEEDCRLIIEASKEAGGKDNITAVVAEVEGSVDHEDADTVTAPIYRETDSHSLHVTAEEEPRKKSKGKMILWAVIYTLVVAGAAALITIGIVKQRDAQENGADEPGKVMPVDSTANKPNQTPEPTVGEPAASNGDPAQETTPANGPTKAPTPPAGRSKSSFQYQNINDVLNTGQGQDDGGAQPGKPDSQTPIPPSPPNTDHTPDNSPDTPGPPETPPAPGNPDGKPKPKATPSPGLTPHNPFQKPATPTNKP